MRRTAAGFAVAVLVAAATASTHGQASHESMQGDIRNFVDTMTIAGVAEVKLGNLAAQRASSPDVKAFGQMMVSDGRDGPGEVSRYCARFAQACDAGS